MMTNHESIKKHDIQIGDFVDFESTLSGRKTIRVTSILNAGIIVGHDINNFERHFQAKRAVRNNLQ